MSLGESSAGSWVPPTCTLPTIDQPLRTAEFEDLLGAAVMIDRPEPTRTVLTFDADPAIAAKAADLAVRETACCSFFTFTITVTGGSLTLEVSVPPARADVLAALPGTADPGVR